MGSAAPGMGGLPTYRYDVLELEWPNWKCSGCKMILGEEFWIPVWSLKPVKI